jgi:hypothetical protein
MRVIGRVRASRFLLLLCFAPMAAAQWQGAPSPEPASNADFFQVEVSKSLYVNGGDAKPIGAYIVGSVDGKDNWTLSCMKEDQPESIPCTPLEPGTYPAMWAHHWTLLAILAQDRGQTTVRFFDVKRASPGAPPAHSAVPMSFAVPKGKQVTDYPLLLHVYGNSTQRYIAWTLPESTSCTATSNGDDSVRANCTTYPASNIEHEFKGLFATLDGDLGWDISCTAGWVGSNCAALNPGFYAARWKDDRRRQLRALVVYRNGKVEEVTFDIKRSELRPPAGIPGPPR